jgi:hypothetical protein
MCRGNNSTAPTFRYTRHGLNEMKGVGLSAGGNMTRMHSNWQCQSSTGA